MNGDNAPARIVLGVPLVIARLAKRWPSLIGRHSFDENRDDLGSDTLGARNHDVVAESSVTEVR